MQRYTLAALAVLIVLLPAQQALKADQALYTIQDLGQTADGRTPTVTGLNAKGQVTGVVMADDGNPRAVRFTDGFGWEYLTGLGDIYSVASGINESGEVVGYHFTADFRLLAFRYSDTGGVEDILPVGNGMFTFGLAINDLGDVVGMSMLPTGESVGFRAARSLPAVPLPPFTQVCGINNDGAVAGHGLAPLSTVQHAYRMDAAGTLTEIASFNGPDGVSDACAIDENGRFGGQAADGAVRHAFAYTPNGLANLDPFGSTSSNTQSIAAGRSVGFYEVQGSTRAFMHSDVTGSVDLNTLIAPGTDWVLLSADGVNKAGQIVGSALKNGVQTTYRLSPAAAAKDTTPPVFTSLTATPSIIFPPKGQKVTVTVSGEATDDSGVMPVCKLTSVTGPGAAGVDFEVTGANTASVAAVGGRTYSMNVTCVDASNNAASQSVDVFVKPDTTAPVIASVTATPSTIWPPDGSMKPVTVAVTASDDVDDQPLCYLSDVTAAGAAAGDSVIRGTFSADVRAVGGRTYAMNVTCSDRAGNHSARSVNVVVPPDTTAPVITELSVTPNAIWPPNGKMVPVQVGVSATDDVDAAPSCALSSISGSSADATITGAFTANVRALKSSDEYDRVYVLTVTCSDRAKNKSSRTVSVVVSKNDPSLNYTGNPGKGNSGHK